LKYTKRRTRRVGRRGVHTIALAAAVGVGATQVRAQLASLDRGHQILVNDGIQIWGADSNTADNFSYTGATGANLNAVMWGFPAHGGDILSTGFKWGKWTDPYGSPSTALNSTEQAHAADLVGLSVGDEQDINTVGSADYNATVAWFQARNAGNYFPNTLCFVNHFFYNDNALIPFIQAANPDAISFDSYPFSNPAGHYITIPNWLAKSQQVRREALGSYIGATGNSARPYGLYTQTYHDSFAIDPGEVEIRWQQFAAATMGYTITDAFLYAGGNTVFNQQGTLYNNYKETARQIKNIGPALVNLISYGYGTSIVVGKDQNGTTNPVPGDWLAFNKTNAPTGQQYLSTITNVSNVGTKNNGFAGDVYVGFFNPLQMTWNSVNVQGEAYFMVMNGLGAELTLNGESDTTATAIQCQQSITLNFDFGNTGITSLDRLRRSDGQVEVVPLAHDSGSLYHYTFTLDGGTGDLFKYDDGKPFVGTNWIPSPPPPPPPPAAPIYWDVDGSSGNNNVSTGSGMGGSET